MAVTDCAKRIVLVLAGMQRRTQAWLQVVEQARLAMNATFPLLTWTNNRVLPDNGSTNRRGPHHTAGFGLSHGGGQIVSSMCMHANNVT